MKYLLIALGGGLGSLLRHELQIFVQRFTAGTFPTGTLAVNVIGCLAIGFLSGLFDGPRLVPEEYKLGLTVGVLGGFTTFSAFGLDTFRLLDAGEAALAIANILLSCVLGVAAVLVAYRLAVHWFGA